MLFPTFVALSLLHIGADVSKFNHFPVPVTIPISVIIILIGIAAMSR